MTYDNDGQPRELRNRNLRSDGTLRKERSYGGWIAGVLALGIIAMAVIFLLPNRTDTTVSNNGATVTSPARLPRATTTGSGATSSAPVAPMPAPATTR